MMNETVYDVGMNNGDDSRYYLDLGYDVVAVEANPELCRQAAARFKTEVGQGRLKIVNVAISDRAGELDFWINKENSEWSALSREVAARSGHSHESIRIKSVPVTDLFKEHGVPHYLKVDIEIADKFCVEALKDAPKLPRYVSVEFTEEALVDTLCRAGYKSFKLVEQVSHLPVGGAAGYEGFRTGLFHYLLTRRNLLLRAFRKPVGFHRIKALSRPSRRDPKKTFPSGSSGTFGEDIPCNWIDRETTVRLWKENTLRWNRWGRDFWCDLHARLD